MIMLNKNIIIITLILSSLFVHSQNELTEVTYKKMSRVKIESQNKQSLRKFNMLNEAIENQLEQIEYSLKFSNNESIFQSNKTMTQNNDALLSVAISIGGGGGIVYSNIEEGIVNQQIEIGGDVYIVESKIESNNWVLSNETKKIDDYVCYKATMTTIIETVNGAVNRKLVAWYSKDISAPFGPAIYNGLPGLIMELEIGKFTFYITKINFHIKETFVKPLWTKKKKITKNELREIEKKGFDKYKKM